jgi:hypothetical protein
VIVAAWSGAELKPDFIVISEWYRIFPSGSIACEREMWSNDSYKQGLPDNSEVTD